MGATSNADVPHEERHEQDGGEGDPQHGRRPGGDPGCNRRRRVQPGEEVRGDHRAGNADRNRRKDGPTAVAGAERQGVGKALRHDEESQHSG